MSREQSKTLPRPLPRPNAYMRTQPFWDAADRERLVIQYCPATGRFQHFPRPVSLYTGRRNLEWKEVSGRGVLYSWTLTFTPWPGHEDRAPYLCALVDLDEGVRILANFYNCRPEMLRIGMPVRLVWERLDDKFNYPAFEPAIEA
jgi:uncharacterized OB-fold protein